MALNYDLAEDQQILRDSVRKFAEGEIKPKAQELDDKEQFSVELTRQMAEMGLFGMVVSPEYEGQGMA